MSKFSLSKASTGKAEGKRIADAAVSGPPSKVPKVNEMTIESPAAPRRKPAVAPVQVCIYKYSSHAGDLWENFKDDDVPLWQIQIDHNAQRSICFRLRESFEDYLRSAHTSDETMPTTLADLEKAAGIRLAHRLACLSVPATSNDHVSDAHAQLRSLAIGRIAMALA